MTKIYNWKNNINENELNNVIETLKNNELVILPTETVYGLAASAFSDEACEKIFTTKGRAQDNPLIVHVANKQMIYDITQKPTELEEKLIDIFMPGPFTLILNRKNCICDTATCFRKNCWYQNA
jgi:L-threonylcarbamoyladenylate synthase